MTLHFCVYEPPRGLFSEQTPYIYPQNHRWNTVIMSAGPLETYNGTTGVADNGGDSLTSDLNVYYSVCFLFPQPIHARHSKAHEHVLLYDMN